MWARVSSGAAILLALALASFEGPAQILCLALLVGVGIHHRKSLTWGWFETGLGVWFLAGAVGVVGSQAVVSSGDVTRPLMALAAFLGPAIVLVPSAERARWAWTFGIAASLNAAYGLLQVAYGPFSWDGMFVSNLKSPQLFIPGRVFHELAASGTFYNRVRFAFVMAPALVLTTCVCSDSQQGLRTRVLAGLGSVLLVAGLMNSHVRSVLVAALLSTTLVLFLSSKRKLRSLAIGAVLSSALVAAMWGPLSQRALKVGAELEIRAEIFLSALNVMMTSPWFGVGHGHYRAAVEPFATPDLAGARLNSAHNLYLMVGAEAGVVGVIGFAMAIAVALGAATRALKGAGTQDRVVWAVILTFLLSGVFHFSLHHASGGLLFWLAVGVAIASSRTKLDVMT